jgi:hypothetical protein
VRPKTTRSGPSRSEPGFREVEPVGSTRGQPSVLTAILARVDPSRVGHVGADHRRGKECGGLVPPGLLGFHRLALKITVRVGAGGGAAGVAGR